MAIPNTTNGKYQPAGLWQLLGFNERIDQLQGEVGYTTIGINGTAHRRNWSAIQPLNATTYDWSYVDAAVQLAIQMGKRLSVLVSMGIDCPPWVFATPGMTTFTSSTGLVYPAPWDTKYQAVLKTFIKAFGARYDTNPLFAYVTMAGWGKDHFMQLCLSSTDNATLAATTYNGVTGNQLWNNAFSQILAMWQAAFPNTKLIANYLGVTFPTESDTLAIAASNAGKAQAGNQFGIKWNNADVFVNETSGPPYAFMLANTLTNPAGYQMAHTFTDYSQTIDIVKTNLGWFMELYAKQINNNPDLMIPDNNHFIDYVNPLTTVKSW